MTITVSGNWKRAMERAQKEGLKPTLCTDGTFSVPSVSRPGTAHTVLLDDSGHIVHCTQCKGWEKGGRSNPCKHAGAVALARIFLRGASITVSEQPTDRPIRGRSQLYREV